MKKVNFLYALLVGSALQAGDNQRERPDLRPLIAAILVVADNTNNYSVREAGVRSKQDIKKVMPKVTKQQTGKKGANFLPKKEGKK